LDVKRLLGFTEGRIRYWDKIGFLTPSLKIGRRKYYTSQDLVGLRTAKGLLDAGLPFAEVRRSVIDMKKIFPVEEETLSRLLIHTRERRRILTSKTVRFDLRGQFLIGFSPEGFEKQMRSANVRAQVDFEPELAKRETSRGNSSEKRRSIKPKKAKIVRLRSHE
jgi:DNA-binding transcriptional MerR regulator